MKTEKITVDSREFTVTEFKAIDIDSVDFSDKKTSTKKQVQLATGISDEEYNNLTFKERAEIFKCINRLNGLVMDFSQPVN